MEKIILLEPVLMERIWGGTQLKDIYNYPIPSDKTGEAWVISAHKDGSSIILNGEYKGKTLRWLYENHKELFSNIDNKEFPLLVKVLDAQADLSVQVHPNDELAVKYNDLGKTECWYVLDCKKDANLVYGHTAKTKEEFEHLVNTGKWDKLLKTKKIKPGDFVYVPAGKIHALTAGTLILEIQQSSNITFRLYDYDRLDDKGNKRQLHIKESIEVATIPDKGICNRFKLETVGNNKFEQLVKSEFFTVNKWQINEKTTLNNPSFLLVSILEGSGLVDDIKVKKGDHFIITSLAKEFSLDGKMELMVSHL